MIDIVRIVEDQANLSSWRATLNEERATQLELLIEMTKPQNLYSEWHFLIATPFRYSPPFQNARFRPRFSKRNVFYGALSQTTAFYEYAFHFMRERVHLKTIPETGQRTLFFVEADDCTKIRIHDHPDCNKIMDKNDYTASHHFIENNPEITFILYPSCRDPDQGDNAAILDIQHLAKNPKWETTVKFFYDYKKKMLTWIGHDLQVKWS